MLRRTASIVVALALLLLAGAAAPAGAKPKKAKLKPPSSLKAGLVTPSTVQLKWKDRSKEKVFEVKVKPKPKPKKKIKAKRDSEDVTVAGLRPKTSYKFKVRACKGKKCGKYTKAKKVKTHKVPAGMPAFGFNEGLVPGDPGNALLDGSGAGFVRVPISWAQTQPSLLSYSWGYLDKVQAALAAQGLKPLWVVTGSPCWARLDPYCEGGNTDKAPLPAFYPFFANLIVKMAKRYPGSTGIQIWNEPNIPKFWAPTPSASEYRKLLVQTAAAVRNSGSPVPVVYGAPSPIDAADAKKDPKKIPATTFLRNTLKGPVPGLDAVALHPYAFNEPGNQIKNGIAIYDQEAAVLDSVSPSLPVWVTEIGFTTESGYKVSPEEQAAALGATFEALVKRGVKLISVHRLFDQTDPDLAFERGMGVIRSDRKTVKPAFCSLAILRGMTPAGCK
jgi:polysaccharide biosynthesis protein PslG